MPNSLAFYHIFFDYSFFIAIMEDSVQRPSISSIFQNGSLKGVKNEKQLRMFQNLKWRQAFQHSTHYYYSCEPETSSFITEQFGTIDPSYKQKIDRNISSDNYSFSVEQISNGELKGLGTGTFVWPASHVLSKFIEKKFIKTSETGSVTSSLQGLKVLELGAGTALCGFVCSLLGANVILTDQDILLDFMQKNILDLKSSLTKTGSLSLEALVYDWDNKIQALKDGGPYDILLISDCILPKLYPIDILVDVILP